MRLISAQGMKKVDEVAIQRENIPSLTLMECAADGIVNAIEELAGTLEGICVAVFCGRPRFGWIRPCKSPGWKSVAIGDPPW